MAVDLREKWSNKEDFVTWLQSEGVSAVTIHTLEGQICSYSHAQPLTFFEQITKLTV